MLLLVGLGNPGPKYAKNRHNIGFMAVDRIAARHGFGPWRARFQSDACEGSIAGVKALLLKPRTYMNESGRAVAEAARFYKAALSDLAVFHDELDLAPGKLRVKVGGGNAGHNGLRSITAHMGNDYKRVRLGIGHPGRDAVLSYVLNDFGKSEQPWVDGLTDAVAEAAELLARNEDESFQNKVHLRMEAAGFANPQRIGEARA
ncbi:aminoacyl-tRNA hydrolase [Hansschlegelia beijingensis]|uniref:Peptidyl-tRNA hydrolase n=1 Tax=Hansschlegelia beijingensis TaxID=1133344 RepID=A0A7W6D1K6_9HYPH|nr:aminoacyl-tRNA hydrolase [Hansschlegelia beijingensis]MBB3971548.1 PTH1 family peptidyl-tRNA hydrolase [Hansschlegelia beijingensis]